MTPRAPSFDLLREPWIPCERRDGTLVYLGIEETLVEAHALGAVHDESPLVTVTLHRMLLAILHRVYLPGSLKEWTAIWRRERLDARQIRAYLHAWRERFDLFHPERPFLQVARLEAVRLGESGKAAIVTPAWRLAPERSQHSVAACLFARLPDDPAISPAEGARSLLAFLGYVPGGRAQNDPASRKAGPLRPGAAVIVQGGTLRETLLLNLTWDPDRWNEDVPPWERPEPTQRTASTRRPIGIIDALVWPSRRVILIPSRDASGALVIRDVITAAGEDISSLCPACGTWGPGIKKPNKPERCPSCGKAMMGQPPDPMIGYVRRDGAPDPVGFGLTRAIWRDVLGLIDPSTGARAFRQPATLAQLAEVARAGVVPLSTSLHVELYGLMSDQAAIRDWGRERLPLPLALLVTDEHVVTLRAALDDAEDVGELVRKRVLYALAVGLLGATPHQDSVQALREELGTMPAYWSELGGRFTVWLRALGGATVSDLETVLSQWREVLREVAYETVRSAILDLGLAGPAPRAGLRAEGVLVKGLMELLPLAPGMIGAAGLALPKHELPPWTDETGFLPHLAKLVEDENLGALAELRQSLIYPRGMAPEAAKHVLPFLREAAGRRERVLYYRVAAWVALHREQARGISVAQAMRGLHDMTASGDEPSSASAMLEDLLAAHRDDVAERVGAALPWIYERGLAVDWELLLHDLIFWGRRDALVEREWLQQFWFATTIEVS
jgi:CRISPR system Cascade subunit CasA